MKRAAAIWMAIRLLPALLPASAMAQDWKAYSYPTAGFAVQFPLDPTVQTGTFTTATGVALPMTRYEARQDRVVFSVDVIDFSSTHPDANRTIADAEKAVGMTGKVTVAIDARVNREFGRELSVNGADGSRSAIALFFVDGHLFKLEGKSLPPDAIARSGDTTRFEESLQFIGANGGFGGFGGFGGGRFGRGRGGGAFNPQAVSACQGKAAGDSVQLQTPRGTVTATCTLIARPNGPPPGGPPPDGPPPGGPPANGGATSGEPPQ
jgi:hypothetical protein